MHNQGEIYCSDLNIIPIYVQSVISAILPICNGIKGTIINVTSTSCLYDCAFYLLYKWIKKFFVDFFSSNHHLLPCILTAF